MDSVRGRVYSMSGDQMGCRQLQYMLGDGGPEVATAILAEVQDHLADLMTDPFGNYLFQKLLEHVSDDERASVVFAVAHRLTMSGMSLHGTRSVQKVVELARSPTERAAVVQALENSVVDLATNPNGNHVIQRVLQHFSAEGDSMFVYAALERSCFEVATHRHGCCVVQRALDAASLEQRLSLVAQVAGRALEMMQDPFGNYVVQYVLDKCAVEEVDVITRAPMGQVVHLSTQKFSSNVVEKCLEKAQAPVQSAYVAELIAAPSMSALLHDQYANYVIQRALSVAPREDVALLSDVVRPHLALMRNSMSTGGRRIFIKMLKRFPEMAPTHAEIAAAEQQQQQQRHEAPLN
ncbi:armadillo-type protein [Tribonema minus]|uniref:Armadillo-type protein n=1 Tax=Tribonema minus TaxID=303371 RepID=A0A835Z1X2_9STRA|nr:armadillo-type protein [Tribonema minus]